MDKPDYFREAMESLMNQTLLPSEIILAVDGPVGDQLKKEIQVYERHSLVRCLWLSENSGRGLARHQAILVSTKNVIALMDADDVSVKNRFELQSDAMSSQPTDVLGGFIGEFVHGNKGIERIRPVPLTHEQIVRRGRWSQPFNHVTIMFRKDVYLRSGGYRAWRKIEDYDLFHRMINSGARFLNLCDILVLVRTSNSQLARRKGVDYLREELRLYGEMLDSKYLNRYEYARNILIRLMVRFMPMLVQRFLFNTFLRKSFK